MKDINAFNQMLAPNNLLQDKVSIPSIFVYICISRIYIKEKRIKDLEKISKKQNKISWSCITT